MVKYSRGLLVDGVMILFAGNFIFNEKVPKELVSIWTSLGHLQNLRQFLSNKFILINDFFSMIVARRCMDPRNLGATLIEKAIFFRLMNNHTLIII